MKNIYTLPDTKQTFGASVFPPASGVIWGTHSSQWSIGGYMELPELTDLHSIPIDLGVAGDGCSSGRRKIGMIVYVQNINRFFQLRPRDPITKNYVSLEEFQNIVCVQERLALLDPMFPPTWATNGNGDFLQRGDPAEYYEVQGSQDPTDCWTELCLDCGGGLEFLDVYTNATLTSLSANKIIHFHTTSTTNLTVSLDFTNSDSSLQCSPGFNTAVMNAGAGMLTLSGVKGVSTVLDAQHSGAFIYVKSLGDAYAVGRL